VDPDGFEPGMHDERVHVPIRAYNTHRLPRARRTTPAVSATFEGQTCLVSGAGSGIGAATPILLAERGASVGLVGLATDPLDDVAETIRATGGRAMSLPADVADATEIAHAVSVTETAFGPLTMAVNSAAVAGSEVEPHEDSVGDWNHVMGVNLSGAFFSLRAEAGAMLLAGSGSIVNIASVHTIHTLPHRAAYTASKHGVLGLTRNAALEYASRGIRVNAVSPGTTNTPMLASGGDQSRRQIARVPRGRMADPSEIAGAPHSSSPARLRT
jgi:NAD(P)-dependent dehydrogenase (short-subunit alcohol dehydrogenase family)